MRIYSEGFSKKDRVKYWVIIQHEKGKRRIPIERLYDIAETLSVSIMDLIPIQRGPKNWLKRQKEKKY